MAQKIAQSLLALLLLLSLIVPPAALIACGPFFPSPVFVERSHPDLPLDKYAAGTLGVLQNQYSPSYLAVAYRYLSSQPLDASEQQQTLDLWNHYLHPEDDKQQDAGNFAQGQGLNRFQEYANCLDDAHVTAEKTLAARSAQFGAGSVAVMSWSDAQEAVFGNCTGVSLKLPEVADASLPPIIKKDRDYQVAAAYFYAGQWDEAKKRFEAISADSASPWRATAALVAVRCDIRSATLGSDDPVVRQMYYAAADAQLKKLIANPAFSEMKPGAERLRGFVEFRLDPYGRMLELSNLIERRAAPEALRTNLDDYNQLFRRAYDVSKMATVRQNSDMADWIASFTGLDKEDRRVLRWQQSKSLPWLVAALAFAQPDTPQLANLVDAASKVPATSPAYLTVEYHRDRLLAATGKEAQVRTEIDDPKRIPPDVMTPSAQNLFLSLRMKVAKNLDEFLKSSPRTVARFEDDFSGYGTPVPAVEFDADAAAELTRTIPSSLLAQAAKSASLSADLRFKIAQSAWTRAILLNDGQAARQIAPALFNKDFVDASSDPARNFAAAFVILQHPELRPYVVAGPGRQAADGQIDNYRDNWWCAAQAQTSRPTASPGFLSDKDRQVAQGEWAKLSQLDDGPSWLAQQVLTYAKAHPQDARVPEALHLVVVATHLGCSSDGDSAKAAFTLLHNRYPKSSWAAQTPYWYN